MALSAWPDRQELLVRALGRRQSGRSDWWLVPLINGMLENRRKPYRTRNILAGT